GLVTCRQIHVAKLGVRCHKTAPGTHGYERAVAALLPRMQTFKAFARALAQRVAPIVDVTSRLGLVAREPRATVKRSVRPDRVGVRHVHMARTARDAVGRREPALLSLNAQKPELIVRQIARIAASRTDAAAFASGRHAGAGQGLLDGDGRKRKGAVGEAGWKSHADDGLEVHFGKLVRELLLLQKVEQGRVASDRRLVEVAADGHGHLRGDESDVLDDSVERALTS